MEAFAAFVHRPRGVWEINRIKRERDLNPVEAAERMAIADAEAEMARNYRIVRAFHLATLYVAEHQNHPRYAA